MKYAIYPPLGCARLGNSPDAFFVGPEQAGTYGVEIQPDGSEIPVSSFKDNQFRMKRQAARFHLFEIPEDGSFPRPANLPDGTIVRWNVHMVNNKDAVVRPPSPPAEPQKPVLDPSRLDRVISARGQVEGASAKPCPLNGIYCGAAVNLGNIRTDRQQRLLVLGGSGRSQSPSGAPIVDFYNSPDWFDDVGDGPVTATIFIPGEAPIEAAPAWVTVAPPDFAPACLGVVTLYDVVLQVAITAQWLTWRDRPFFDTDIRPLIERASAMRWVHGASVWSQISQDWPALADPSPQHQPLRTETAVYVAEVSNELSKCYLMEWQKNALNAWVDGSFEPGSAPDAGLHHQVIRTMLDTTVGAGFYPGIEAGINIVDPGLYLSQPFEFRFDPLKITAGDMTAHMALPWQADFLKCRDGWWPTQRPDFAPQTDQTLKEWLRPIVDHQQLIDIVMKLGVVSPSSGGHAVEQGRDPILGE